MALQRVLGVRDIVLFNVAATLSLRWLSLAAAIGPSSLVMWGVAGLALFMPIAYTVVSLSSAFPEEGGLYVWAKLAFGERQGFLCGWAYSMSVLAYFPGATLAASIYALYIFNFRFAYLEKSRLYTSLACVVVLLIVLILNTVGVKKGRWVQNLGGFALWIPPALLLFVGVLTLMRSGSATPMPVRSFMPRLSDLGAISALSQMSLAYTGMELAAFLGGEIRDPQRTFRRAIPISALMIIGGYVLGTLALMWALPSSQTSIISGVNQAVASAAAAQGLGGLHLGELTALLMTVGVVGSIGAFLVGNARLLFVAGLDRYLPSALGRIHPRWNTPHVALIAQAAIAMLLVILATQGGTVQSAYLKLVNATVILTLLPFLYVFAAVVKLRARIAATPGAVSIPGGRAGAWITAVLGCGTILLAIALAFIPPAEAGSKTLFALWVFLGSFVPLAIGWGIFEWNRRGAAGSAHSQGSMT